MFPSSVREWPVPACISLATGSWGPSSRFCAGFYPLHSHFIWQAQFTREKGLPAPCNAPCEGALWPLGDAVTLLTGWPAKPAPDALPLAETWLCSNSPNTSFSHLKDCFPLFLWQQRLERKEKMLFYITEAPRGMNPGAGPTWTSGGALGMGVPVILLCSVWQGSVSCGRLPVWEWSHA